ncbi:hypothetical protein Acr_25g0011240 [Actinidia rufa]|uniref:ARM repeat superfamily protein n=1 Tax=Actinidia rufa TaxID=165716 RepID=A0A7J0H116_9ERIC|nr:hypothetical protein Acr_25g0011240 [Actinidia rufa]
MEENQPNQHKLKLLESLKKASKDLQTKPIHIYIYTNLAAIKTFLELQTQLDTVLSTDPSLSNLSQSLSNLKTQLTNLQNSQDYNLVSFFRRQIANYEISKICGTIENEAQAWIDQESIKELVQVLQESKDEEEKIKVLTQFEKRVSNCFDRDLQEMILKAKVFPLLESIVSKSKCPKRVCETSARAIVALVRFNKDVFTGLVLMGPIIRTLVSMDSCGSVRVISSLVKLIKSPLVYEMEANGYILRIISLLNSNDFSLQASVLECVLELAYFTRREAVEEMIQEGVIRRLVELQRVETKGEMGECDGEEMGSKMESEGGFAEDFPFSGCVTRFVVNLEMGEGLEMGEKRQLKQEILRRAREASVSEAEATSLVTEVLWGSSPLLH